MSDVRVNIKKLEAEQLKLAKKVSTADSFDKIKTVAGVSVTIEKETATCGIVVLQLPDYKLIEEKASKAKTTIPYIPFYSFYQTGPAILETYSLLENKPDLLLIEGSGILHPRRIGIASQLGVLIDKPIIGITKKIALGEKKDKTIYLDKEALCHEVQTREHANPLYVSPGNKISLKSSTELIKKMIVYPHKYPEPIHRANKFVRKIRKTAQ